MAALILFQNIVFASLRYPSAVFSGLSNQINHLATALNIGVGSNDGWNGLYHKLNVRFSGALQEYKVRTLPETLFVLGKTSNHLSACLFKSGLLSNTRLARDSMMKTYAIKATISLNVAVQSIRSPSNVLTPQCSSSQLRAVALDLTSPSHRPPFSAA